MNAIALAAPLPLAEALGAVWRVGAATCALAWDGAAWSAWFGLEDGSIAIVKSVWEGQGGVRARPGGGVELVPPSAPAPAVARLSVHRGACLALAADAEGGFLSGGADGELALVRAGGAVETLARFAEGPAAALAVGRGGWRVCAAGPALLRFGASRQALTLPDPVGALEVAPNGSRLAIGQADGVALWAGAGEPRRLEGGGRSVALAWSKDARFVASAGAEGKVVAWEVASGTARTLGPVRAAAAAAALARLADGRIVASADGAVEAWRLPEAAAERCGVASRDVVTRLACPARRGVVAAGYRNGAIVVCRPGPEDLLFVRAAGDGPVAALAWSPGGEALAYAVGGDIGLVTLPGALFRDGAGA